MTSPARRGARRAGVGLALGLLIAMAALGGLAFWDEQREFEAALEDFAAGQVVVASSVAAGLDARAASSQGASASPLGDAVAAWKTLERPGVTCVLLSASEGSGVRTTAGQLVDSAPLVAALAAGKSSVWLDRPAAAALGLRRRRAAAGIARFDAGALGRGAVFVVSSAVGERDRESRAEARLALTLGLAIAMLTTFGVLALRKQRRELGLARELALSEARRERDAELQQANRAAVLGTLAMGIAHEVSTPLSVITGRAEQLGARLAADERSSRAVRAIAAEADRIRRVVRGFLDLARGASPTRGAHEAATVLRAAVAMVEHRFASAHVGIEVRIESDSPDLRGDREMLEQALVNLLLNACDASPPSSLVVASLRRDEGRLVFDVEDEGSGIPEGLAARVTEPFFTTKPVGQGTGLGLAIAAEIVKLHHGELTLSPRPVRGTKASIVVPLRGASPDAAGDAIAPTMGAAAPESEPRARGGA